MTYELKAPRFFVGQTVNFLHHNKRISEKKLQAWADRKEKQRIVRRALAINEVETK